MKAKCILTLCLAMVTTSAVANKDVGFSSDSELAAWSSTDYQTVQTGTRTTWFVDYYTLDHKQDTHGNNVLVMTFLPEQLTKQKVSTAFIDALEGANPAITMNDPIINGLIEGLTLSLNAGDTVTVIEKGHQIQVQHNGVVVYAFADAGGQKDALLNIWLGENPVDDFLKQV
ncbi:chalcone isomerase family protein [Vibrio superstes]|uniref:Chalcone isomerase domain-containing protein n=1 Tax=Vibrio superstes NBRC 103154 TaxID=1219062 RepID=A0A511QWZ8_9VIBR|nr:chalcone isomerase family protein [Vibrio superstes]GEM81507.1 hypothetical protein VSU01S_37520 [Vibrio superstes NBRC 103154]